MLWLLRDTRTCLLVMTSDLIGNAAGMAGILLLSARFDGIGGMSQDQVLFMLGYAACIDGLFMLFFGMVNTGYISRVIGRGQLDHMLIQPVPLPVQLLTAGFIPFSGSSLLICGLGVTGYAAARLDMWGNPTWVLGMGINLAASVAVILAFSYIIGSSAFYAPVAGEEVSSAAIAFFDVTKRFPLGGLPLPMQVVFCTVLPAGLVAWLPTARLMNLPAAGLPAFFLVLSALVLGTIATFVFRKGLKQYAKYGSQRYSDHGHRR